MLVGPHSPFGNFSVISIAEAQADYVMQCLELYATGRLEALAPRRDATDSYNAELVKAMPGTIWTSGCTSWYLDKHGRPNTFPGTPAEHRALLTEPELAHFEVSTPVVEPSVQR
jgi:hypothetical protein